MPLVNGSLAGDRARDLGTNVQPHSRLIAALREGARLTQEELAHRCGAVDRKTIVRMEGDKPVKSLHLEAVAHYFGVPPELLTLPRAPEVEALLRRTEWNLADIAAWGPAQSLSNGMRVRTAKLQSHAVPGRWGRVKLYDLGEGSAPDFPTAFAMLRRHTTATAKVRSPYVVQTYLCEPNLSERYCYIVDEWIDGPRLSEFSPATPAAVRGVARDLLLGLRALHEKQVICRGLSPATVVVQPHGPAVIVDLEVAKLQEGPHTVYTPRTRIADDPFLALEVREQGRDIRPAADLYSWARLVTWLVTGVSDRQTPLTSDSLVRSGLPSTVAIPLVAALSNNWVKRPQHVDELLGPVGAWCQQSDG